MRWFTEAAERGLADSQFNLAVLHENGLGVAKDDKEAYKWLLLAAQSGDTEATSRRDALKARLSKADRAQAEAAVSAWKPRRIDPVTNDSGARRAGLAGAPARSLEGLRLSTHVRERPVRGIVSRAWRIFFYRTHNSRPNRCRHALTQRMVSEHS